jgi:hypothetical protein
VRIETIAKPLRFCVKIFYKRIDVVFPMASVKTALVQRGIQTGLEVIGLLFDAFENLLDVFVVLSMRRTSRELRIRGNW